MPSSLTAWKVATSRGLGERREGAAVDDPERLADAGVTPSRARGEIGARIEHLDAEELGEVGRRSASAQPIHRVAASCVADSAQPLGFRTRWRSPPTSTRRCSCCSSAGRATATSPRCSAVEDEVRARARAGADRARRRRPRPQRRAHRLPARPGRPDRPRRRAPATCATTPTTTSSPRASPRSCASSFLAAASCRGCRASRARPAAACCAARPGADAGRKRRGSGLSRVADAADRDLRQRGA